MSQRRFQQVDVFAGTPFGGNPVAVVLDADGLTDQRMADIARWTNLSETTFVLPASNPAADYRLRIFTPGNELPFAGHPTLGSAYAWLSTVTDPGRDLVQECGAGLVAIRFTHGRPAFAAPPRTRTGPVDEETLEQVARSLRVSRADLLDHQWVDNGPGWLAVLLESGARVRSLEPDFRVMGDLAVGVIGPQLHREETAFEVRAFCPGHGVDEDPVTGSLNAGLAQWLRATGRAPAAYVVAQGTAIGRSGRVHIEDDDGTIWVGGPCVARVVGTLEM